MTKQLSFDVTRRTGQLSNNERHSLGQFLALFPRPILLCRMLARTMDATGLTIGCYELQDRGWLRVRRGYWWELTPRAVNELPVVGGTDIFTRLPVEIASEAAAAKQAMDAIAISVEEQIERMPLLLAFIGSSAFHGVNFYGGNEGRQKSVFERLLAMLRMHGITERLIQQLCTELCTRAKVTSRAIALARDACKFVAVQDFKDALGRADHMLTQAHVVKH